MTFIFENSYIMVKDTEGLKGQSLFQKAKKTEVSGNKFLSAS